MRLLRTEQTPSGSSSASATSPDRRCTHCGIAITSGRRDKRICGQACQRAVARQRAASWHAEHGKHPDVQERKRSASRRRYEKVREDPDLLRSRREQTARWRASNPDRLRETERRWREDNADAVREKNQRRRARLLDAYVAPVDLELIWERDEGLCGICLDPIDLSLEWPHRRSLTLDHVVALADGGTHEPDNVQLAHAACNSRKGAIVQRGS